MVCDDCPMRADCSLLNQYNKSEDMINNGEGENLWKLYDLLELHEAYVSEMRRDILKKLNGHS